MAAAYWAIASHGRYLMVNLFPLLETISWDDLRVLLAVHRTGSLLAAGKSLGLSTSTAGRRLDALEAAVGVRLVSRSQAGTELEPQAARLIRLAEDLEHGLAAAWRDQHAGAATVKVSVPEGMAQSAAQALIEFRRAHPNVDIELSCDNRMADIAKREADIGLRIGRTTSNVLVEKQVMALRFGIYASAEYVRRHLPSRRLRKGEAERHAFVGLDARWKSLPHEQWMAALGATSFPFRSSSIVAILEAIRQGVGIGALVEQDARNAGLLRIDVELPAPTQPLFLVYHHELRRVPRIRAAVTAIEAFIRRHG